MPMRRSPYFSSIITGFDARRNNILFNSQHFTRLSGCPTYNNITGNDGPYWLLSSIPHKNFSFWTPAGV
jgi:hypothetical protein